MDAWRSFLLSETCTDKKNGEGGRGWDVAGGHSGRVRPGVAPAVRAPARFAVRSPSAARPQPPAWGRPQKKDSAALDAVCSWHTLACMQGCMHAGGGGGGHRGGAEHSWRRPGAVPPGLKRVSSSMGFRLRDLFSFFLVARPRPGGRPELAQGVRSMGMQCRRRNGCMHPYVGPLGRGHTRKEPAAPQAAPDSLESSPNSIRFSDTSPPGSSGRAAAPPRRPG